MPTCELVGDTVKTSLLAEPAEMVKLELNADVNPLDVAVSV